MSPMSPAVLSELSSVTNASPGARQRAPAYIQMRNQNLDFLEPLGPEKGDEGWKGGGVPMLGC